MIEFQLFTTATLPQDLMRELNSNKFSDLDIFINGKVILAHSYIIRVRCPQLLEFAAVSPDSGRLTLM